MCACVCLSDVEGWTNSRSQAPARALLALCDASLCRLNLLMACAVPRKSHANVFDSFGDSGLVATPFCLLPVFSWFFSTDMGGGGGATVGALST